MTPEEAKRAFVEDEEETDGAGAANEDDAPPGETAESAPDVRPPDDAVNVRRARGQGVSVEVANAPPESVDSGAEVDDDLGDGEDDLG